MEIGTQTGPYRTDELLGRGGMAEVFKVWHQDLERHEAMKVLPPAMTHDRSFVERFLREARTAAALQHPNIAAIHAVSQTDAPQPYFTMELIEGGDLADLIETRGRFSLAEALPILRQIAHALDYAHGRGLIHRDIKPANIMLGAGEVKVVDFGMTNAPQAFIGRPAFDYMAPEMMGSGAPVDARADGYSLAAIAYEMLCGQPIFPYDAQNSAISDLMPHARETPRPPIELTPKLSKAANVAMLRALAKDPAERFASCGEFIGALQASAPVAAPAHLAPKPARPARSFPLLPVALGAVLLGATGLVGWSVSKARGNSEIVVMAPAPTAATSADNLIALAPTPVATAAPVQINVPQVVGKTETQARDILKANGLAANVTTGRSAAFEAQQVMGQSPPPGALVAAGAPVTIRISLGAADSPQPRIVRRPDPEPSTEADEPTESDSSTEGDGGGYSFDGPQWPGEKFPQVRQRPMSRDEVEAMSYARVRYAINEAYARRGLTFRDRFIQAVFDDKPWYRGDRSRTTGAIDAEFSALESDNIKLLAQAKAGKSE